MHLFFANQWLHMQTITFTISKQEKIVQIILVTDNREETINQLSNSNVKLKCPIWKQQPYHEL